MKILISCSLLFLSCSMLTGCAHLSDDMRIFLGTSVKDLENARSSGMEKTFSIPYDQAFDTVKQLLLQNGAVIYQSDREKRMIVAMGFKKQVNTTRIGVFFDIISDNKTKITLSSLSKTALAKADKIIFGNMPS